MSYSFKISALFIPKRFAAKLRQAPLPLLDARRRTVISWSAKSACTHVVIWYLNRLGFLDEARDYHSWIHRYRSEVLYGTEMYREARNQLQQEGPAKWSYLKVVRDPVRRCVSSYRHALKHGYEDEKMSRLLGREISHKIGYSYETFLEYLGQIDLRHCDIHHRVQKHSLDTVEFSQTRVVNVDEQDLEAALARIDRMQDCAPLADTRSGSEAIASAARRHADGESGEIQRADDVWRKPLSVKDVEQWPKNALASALRPCELVRDLYRCDYNTIAELAKRSQPLQAA